MFYLLSASFLFYLYYFPDISGYHPQYLIVGAGSSFTRVHYDTIGNPETHGTNLDIGRVQAMAYDNLRGEYSINLIR